METFPNPCSRCGFCCVAMTCPIGMQTFKVPKDTPCPGLSFDEHGQASCEPYVKTCSSYAHSKNYHFIKTLIDNLFGIEKGCCISARALKDGEIYPYASLPAETKKKIVSDVRRK